jgi:hypothetical protein
MLWNNGIKDVIGLFIQKVLLGLKWQELLEIVVDFIPPGMKLTDLSFTQMQEHVVAHIGIFLFEEWIVLGEHMFCDRAETFNMCILCFFLPSFSCSTALPNPNPKP